MRWLDRKAEEEGKSRAAVVREAVSQYRADESKKGIERYFGLWKERSNIPDGLEYERKIRGEWDREWDAKAE
jgi:hypothetical protein